MSGLDDFIAAETSLSEVDGARGRLVIRGHTLDDLAGRTSFEALLSLLLADLAPLPAGELKSRLGLARSRAFAEIAHLDPDLLRLSITEALRALMARLPDGEEVDIAILLAAAPAVFVPAIIRRQAGREAIAPDPAKGHAEDMLFMLSGETPSPAQIAALDTYLVTVSDHGLNASTFAARVVASTRAGYTSAVLAALGALKGPLHGGAPGPVLDMLDAIGSPDHAEAWLSAALARGERLMGFGHRIYRVRDPRADALKSALARLGAAGGMNAARLALAETVERDALALLRLAKPDRPLETNVEFFTALLLEALGFPRDAFTGVFATGRVAGWLAHSHEQITNGRLIRPQSLYVGPKAA
ncbi:citrate synthase/methylcitrate synthase [Devosia sp. FJ2-5-3]|uniref:citrate synthase/methylcitrate synthase n=1 Tax=Devosia sp. FJ2-5-3 TaxID=2976680 RepID=UPI0023D80B70|nr:citrate synthase/methylcitrate synthase [Devosia sp. FJ2-5-3]WEJ57766.1 citrate synthase/methylcitrate synthase [Devosia sp. FJ2-5-3]